MLKRRDLLKSIGAIIGVGVLGEATQAEAAPVETPPVVQAPEVENPYTMGSAVLSPRAFTGISGTVSFSTDGENWHELGKALSWDFTGGDE